MSVNASRGVRSSPPAHLKQTKGLRTNKVCVKREAVRRTNTACVIYIYWTGSPSPWVTVGVVPKCSSVVNGDEFTVILTLITSSL